MSRVLLGLGSFVLTVGLITFRGGDVGSSDSPGAVRGATSVSPCTRPRGSFQIIPVARKKPRVKVRKGAKKEEPADATGKADESPPAAGAKGDGGLKFSRDIAPILVANCVGCHSGEGQGIKKTKLDLSTFEGLRKGSARQEVIVPGDPGASELVLRIRGESQGPKMPPGAQKNLGEGALAKIEQWVKAGAVLDAGNDPRAPLDSYASTPEQLRRNRLVRMKPEERDQLVVSAGLERWKKANPKVTPEVTIGRSVILFSALPKARAEDARRRLEPVAANLQAILGPGAGDGVEKPSFFVFNDRNSFVEFVRTIQGRETEEDERAAADFAKEQPYVAAVDPLGGQDAPAPAKKSARGSATTRDRPRTGPSRASWPSSSRSAPSPAPASPRGG